MIIVHISPNSPYNDNWGYQENLLPRYQKKKGHQVIVIVPNLIYEKGKIIATDPADYFLEDGVRVIRLVPCKYIINKIGPFLAKLPVLQYLIDIKPDFVFFHGLISSTILEVIKYKKKYNKKCTIVQDNHLDYYNYPNSRSGVISIIRRSFYRSLEKKAIKYVDKVYGTTPWRETFALEYFKVPKSKIDLLITGGEDDKIDFSAKREIRERICVELGIPEDAFIIVTGGKIDQAKNIHLLMEAVAKIERNDVYLISFGNATEEMQTKIDEFCKANNNIKHVGWVTSDKSYEFFLMANLVFFPGTHSVMWEQAVACKVPCIFKEWVGMHHVDIGGNCDFISNVMVESIKEVINDLMNNHEKYEKMKMISESNGADQFLYSKIAEKSLETAPKDIE